jgi:recombination protein RecT
MSNNIIEFKHILEKQSSEFKKVLPRHIDVDRFIRIVFSAVRKNPNLLSFSRESLLSACMDAAEDGLIPDGFEAALIVRKGKVCYEPMYQGLMKLAYQSGNLKSIKASVVYENDKFSYWLDDEGEHILYEPILIGDKGAPILTFCQGLLFDGGMYIEIMTEEEMQNIRKMSASERSPWSGAFADEMRKKATVKRMCKMLPQVYRDREYMDDYDNGNPITGLEERKDNGIERHAGPAKLLRLIKSSEEVQRANNEEEDKTNVEVDNEE